MIRFFKIVLCIVLLSYNVYGLEDKTRWHFETGTMGWEPHIIVGDTEGCTNVRWVSNRKFLGNYAIEMQFKSLLAFPNPPDDRGEAWVDMWNNAPRGYTTPCTLALSNVPITFRIYIPSDMYNQNYNIWLQCFDVNTNLWQSSPFNYTAGIEPDKWFETNVMIGGPSGWVDAGFNGNQVRFMGVKLGTGGGGGVGPGSIYIDSIFWNEGNAYPNVPTIISYPEAGFADRKVGPFTAQATDPDGDNISYFFKGVGSIATNYSISYYGYGQTSGGASGSILSGDMEFQDYDTSMSYEIAAMTIDTNGANSDYSSFARPKIYIADYPDPGRYCFEATNWNTEYQPLWSANPQVVTFGRDTTKSLFGSGALRIDVNTTLGQRAAVKVDCRYNQRPAGNEEDEAGESNQPIAGTNKKFVIWCYAPTGARGTNAGKKNGVRMLIDEQATGFDFQIYTPFMEIPYENAWFPVVAVEGVDFNLGGTSIREIGISFESSNQAYNGPIYFDTFMWHNGTTNFHTEPIFVQIDLETNQGEINTNYSLTVKATDTKGDWLCYLIDWGDENYNLSAWTNPGIVENFSHSWSSSGNYQIRIYAIDPVGGLAQFNTNIFIGTPPDLSPGPVTNFIVTPLPQGNALALSWDNPPDADFAGVIVLKKTDSCSINSNDGTLLFQGITTSYTDTGLIDGNTYYYTIYAYDNATNYSSGVCKSGVPQDSLAPSDVFGFIAKAFNKKIILLWNNPGDADFAGVIIRKSTTGFPSSTNDGILIYNGTGTSVTDTNVINNQIYYYTAFTYDEVPNYSDGAYASAMPEYDITVLYISDGIHIIRDFSGAAELADLDAVIRFRIRPTLQLNGELKVCYDVDETPDGSLFSGNPDDRVAIAHPVNQNEWEAIIPENDAEIKPGGLVQFIFEDNTNTFYSSGNTIWKYRIRDIGFLVNNVVQRLSDEKVSIVYRLDTPAKISMKIYNINGDIIYEVKPFQATAGQHLIQWDCKADNKYVSQGIYFLFLKIDDMVYKEKILIY